MIDISAQLFREIRDLGNQNSVDRELVEQLSASLFEENGPDLDQLEELYKIAGVDLPEISVRRFTEVQRFHESIVSNRQLYLKQELDGAKRRVGERDEKMNALDGRRAEVLSVLRSHGALEHLMQLQGELTKVETEVERTQHQYAAAEQLEGHKNELELERRELLTGLQRDYRERDAILRRAILAFEELSRDLYEDAGSLTIDPSVNNGMDSSSPGRHLGARLEVK